MRGTVPCFPCYGTMPFYRCIMLAALAAGLGTSQSFAAQDSASVNPPALLSRAVEQYLQNQDHWAYTVSRSLDGVPERPKGATVLMVDPSRAYADQIRPLKVDG